MRVNPLTREIAESVRNDEDEKVKPKDKDLQHNFLMKKKTQLNKFLKDPPPPRKKEKKVG